MAGIISAFKMLDGDFLTSKKNSQVILCPLNSDGKIDNDLGGVKVLQYWPESLSINKSQNWQEKSIPGLNLPLYQWVSGGGRSLSFTAVFSRDMDGDIGTDFKEDKNNVDIDAAIAWLNLLSSSDYEAVGDMNMAVAPPVLWMNFIGSSIGYNEGNKNIDSSLKQVGLGIHCIMTEIGETRMDWFPSGRPRYAEVSLSFNEVIQVGQNVIPYGRNVMKQLALFYTRTTSK